jgi:hypothetical protein
MFASLSLRTPGVRDHLLNYIALAPVITLSNPTELLKELSNSKIPELVEFLHIYEFLGTGWYNEVWASSMCSIIPKICNYIIAG